MASKNQGSSGSSQSQRDSQTKSSKRSSLSLESKKTHHQKTNSRRTPSNDSRNSRSIRGAVTHSTQKTNQDINTLHLRVSDQRANECYHEHCSRKYATNVLAGAASLDIEIPLHLQKSLVDRYRKSWPRFDPSTGTLEDANVSTYAMAHEIENYFVFFNWSVDGGLVHGEGSGSDFLGIGTQFE